MSVNAFQLHGNFLQAPAFERQSVALSGSQWCLRGCSLPRADWARNSIFRQAATCHNKLSAQRKFAQLVLAWAVWTALFLWRGALGWKPPKQGFTSKLVGSVLNLVVQSLFMSFFLLLVARPLKTRECLSSSLSSLSLVCVCLAPILFFYLLILYESQNDTAQEGTWEKDQFVIVDQWSTRNAAS